MTDAAIGSRTSSVFTRAKNFWALPRARKRLLLEAAGALLRAWWLVRRRPFRDYATELGRTLPGEFVDETRHDMPMLPLGQVHWALHRINRLAGGRFTCLMLGIAGKRMLDRRGLANTLVLGVRPDRGDGGDPLGAHAWLRAGQYVVVGLEERAGHIPVASYHSATGNSDPHRGASVPVST